VLTDALVYGSFAVPFVLTFFARAPLWLIAVLGAATGLVIWAIAAASGALETNEGTGEELGLAYGVPIYTGTWLVIGLVGFVLRWLADRRRATTS
jgi:hypothetical protein